MLRFVIGCGVMCLAASIDAGETVAQAVAPNVSAVATAIDTVNVATAHVVSARYVTRCEGGRCRLVPARSVAVSRVRTGRLFVFRPWLRNAATARTRTW